MKVSMLGLMLLLALFFTPSSDVASAQSCSSIRITVREPNGRVVPDLKVKVDFAFPSSSSFQPLGTFSTDSEGRVAWYCSAYGTYKLHFPGYMHEDIKILHIKDTYSFFVLDRRTSPSVYYDHATASDMIPQPYIASTGVEIPPVNEASLDPSFVYLRQHMYDLYPKEFLRGVIAIIIGAFIFAIVGVSSPYIYLWFTRKNRFKTDMH